MPITTSMTSSTLYSSGGVCLNRSFTVSCHGSNLHSPLVCHTAMKGIEGTARAAASGELKVLDMVPTPSQCDTWRRIHIRYTSPNPSKDVSTALSASSPGGLRHPSWGKPVYFWYSRRCFASLEGTLRTSTSVGSASGKTLSGGVGHQHTRLVGISSPLLSCSHYGRCSVQSPFPYARRAVRRS